MISFKKYSVLCVLLGLQASFLAAMENSHQTLNLSDSNLRKAIEKNDISRAKQAIADQASINMVYPGTNSTPLLLAARQGRIKIIELLDNRGVDVEASLVRAVENNDLYSLQFIANTVYKNQSAIKNLPSTIDPFQYKNDAQELTALAKLTDDDIPDTFATILARANSGGITPLFAAIQNDNEPIIKWLLQQGISQQEITLVYIFMTDNQKIVKKLIAHNPQILNQRYILVPLLHYAIMNDKFAHAQTLIDEGININTNGGYNNRTALMELILKDNVPSSLVTAFLTHPKIDFYQVDYEGNNVLHLAVENHKTNMVKKLKKHANVQSLNVRNKKGKTPVQLARDYGFVDIHRILESKGKGPEVEERPHKRQRRRK